MHDALAAVLGDRQWLTPAFQEYGSAASRSPSPTKLKAITVAITNSTGSISHGCSATVRMFCASCSSTPLAHDRRTQTETQEAEGGLGQDRWSAR